MYQKGDRVENTGLCRKPFWGKIYGTVERATKRSVFVRWDGTHFSDEMTHEEVQPSNFPAPTD